METFLLLVISSCILHNAIANSSTGSVLQMHYPNVVVAAQENGSLTAQSGKDGDIVINPKGGSVYFDNYDLTDIKRIVDSLPPIWLDHADVGFVGTFEGGQQITIPFRIVDPQGGSLRFAVVAGNVPTGVKIDSLSQIIAGIAPNEDAFYTFTVRATNSVGKYADNVFTMETREADQCSSEPCSNSGLCNNTKDTYGYRCKCIGVYGGRSCDIDCRINEVGVASNETIPDAQLSAYLSQDTSQATFGRLNGTDGGWCGVNANSWLQIDLGKSTKVLAASVQGRNSDYYTSSYTLSYSTNGVSFSDITDNNSTKPHVFTGAPGIMKQNLPGYVQGRFFRFHPKTYKAGHYPCMSVELYGCEMYLN